MATKITIEHDEETVTVHVTDDTGRDEICRTPRYPRPGSDNYVRFVDSLDVLMATGSRS